MTGCEKAEDQSVHEFLKDGVVLCHLINKLSPNAVKKIHESNMAFKQMENINHFLQAAQAYGVQPMDLFQTVDLYEDKNMSQVLNATHALGGHAQKLGFDGPALGVKHANENRYIGTM